MMAPPLGHVTGAVELAEVYGGFGPVPGAITWRGACIGGCGARPGCRAEEPAPECSGCGRARHGITGDGGARGRIRPVPARVLPGELGGSPSSSPSNGPSPIGPRVLRSAVEVGHDDPSLPAAVRGLVRLAPTARVTAAVAARPDGAIVASLAVRVPGHGFAVYVRGEDGGWGAAGAVLVHPHVRAVGVREFAAALAGVEYAPPPPRPPAAKAPCPSCGAEVNVTKDGRPYKSHRCGTGGGTFRQRVEGRS
jgi:hypothetical protein